MLFQHKFTTLGISEVFSGGAQWWGNRAPIGEGEGEKGGGEEGGGEEGGRGGGWEGGRGEGGGWCTFVELKLILFCMCLFFVHPYS